MNEILYEYLFDFELSVKAYYAAAERNNVYDMGILNIGLEAINRCSHNLPNRLKELNKNNKKFYDIKLNKNLENYDYNKIEIEKFYKIDIFKNNKEVTQLNIKKQIEKIIKKEIVYWQQYDPIIFNNEKIKKHQTEWCIIIFMSEPKNFLKNSSNKAIIFKMNQIDSIIKEIEQSQLIQNNLF